MKLIHHKDLTIKKWQGYSLAEQMANIGSEVIRTLGWRGNNEQQANMAFERSLELFDLTKSSALSVPRRKEVCRLREVWTDFIAGDNQHKTDKEYWDREFTSYTILARNRLTNKE